MTENQNEDRNTESQSNTLAIESEDFAFETVEQHNGQATVVRFRVDNPLVKAGDTLVILSGEEIQFHGLIGRIDDGWAIASDRRGSLLPAMVQ
jgi:hypothetical protein